MPSTAPQALSEPAGPGGDNELPPCCLSSLSHLGRVEGLAFRRQLQHRSERSFSALKAEAPSGVREEPPEGGGVAQGVGR